MKYFNKSVLCLLLLTTFFLLPSCSKKSKKMQITISGAFNISDEERKSLAGSTVFIGVSDAPFHVLLDDPTVHTKHFVATKSLDGYQLTFDPRIFGKGERDLQIFALIDRDFSPQKSPKVTKDDMIGFYIEDLKPGKKVNLSETSNLDANINITRSALGRSIEVEVENTEKSNALHQFGLYCDEINSLSIKSMREDSLIYLRPIKKDGPVFREIFKIELFQAKKTDFCYAFLFEDLNENMKLDSGESFGFYTDRTDGLPSEIDLRNAKLGPLNIKTTNRIPAPRNEPLLVKGKVTMSPELSQSVQRTFVLAIKQNGEGLKFDQITRQVLGFSKIESKTGEFEIDLTQSLAQVGESITVLAIGDQNERGLPILSDGDFLGLSFEDQKLLTKTLVAGINSGFHINLDRKFYEGKSTVEVDLESDYKGKIALIAYGGELTTDQSPDLSSLTNLDMQKVYGLNLAEKSGRLITLPLEVLGLGAMWPLDVFILGLHDTNGNMKPDPGEELLLPLDDEGRPQKLRVNKSEKYRFTLKFPYTVPIPSPYTMTLKGRFHVSDSRSSPYVTILVAENTNIDTIIADPKKHVKVFQKVPTSAKSYSISLKNTPFKPGEIVQVLAVTSDENQGFPKLTDKSLVDFYQKEGKLGYMLKDGENLGIDLVIDKNVYRNKISVMGILQSDYRGPIIAAIYAGNPLNLLNQKYSFDDFIALSYANKISDRFEIKYSDFVSRQSLPVKGFPILIEDANSNEAADPGEIVHFSFAEDKGEPLFVEINIGTIFSFAFNHKSSLPLIYPKPLPVRGKVNIAPILGNAKIYVMAIDPSLNSFSPTEISQKIFAIEEVSLNQPFFTFDLAKAGRKPGDRIILAALIDKDFRDFPRLTTNDLIGFYSGNNAWTYEIREEDSSLVEINVDRSLYDGEATIAGEITTPLPKSDARRLLAVAYTGELTSMTDIDIDPNKIIGFLNVGSVSRFEMRITPIGNDFPINSYIFVVNDLNGNQKLDPEETFYFYSNRSDGIPEKIRLERGQRLTTYLNRSLTISKPKEFNINLSGALSWLNTDKTSPKSAYLFVARANSYEDLLRDPLTKIRYLKKLDGLPTSYTINISQTDLAPEEQVMIGAWIDNDMSLAPNVGDRIGLYQKAFDGYVIKIPNQDISQIDINVDLTLYSTKKSIDAAFLNSSYNGRVLALLYKGGLSGLSIDGLDVKNVVAFSDFVKSSQTSSFTYNVLPTQELPLVSVTALALLDANSNGKPDPGETIIFNSSKTNSFPRYFELTGATSGTVSLNSPFIIQTPANNHLVLRGQIDSNVNSSSNYPTTVAIFSETPLENLTQEPLRFLKEFRVLPAGVTDLTMDLSKTDLKEGEKIMVLAFQNPSPDPLLQTQIVEGSFLGILLNSTTFQTSLSLKNGENSLNADGYSLNIKRKYYDHTGRISEIKLGGTLPFVADDRLMIAAYQSDANPVNLVSLANIDYDKVVSYGQFSFQSPSAIYSTSILQALVPGIVKEDSREIENVLLIAWKDLNKNGKLEDNEPIGFYCDPSNPILPTSLTLRLTNNQFPGSIKFKGESQTTASLGQLLNGGVQAFMALGICQ